jgi:hypothetical protein
MIDNGWSDYVLTKRQLEFLSKVEEKLRRGSTGQPIRL